MNIIIKIKRWFKCLFRIESSTQNLIRTKEDIRIILDIYVKLNFQGSIIMSSLYKDYVEERHKVLDIHYDSNACKNVFYITEKKL